MRGLYVVDDAFSHDELLALRQGALSSPYLSDSPLKGSFEATRGFAVTFRRDGLAAVEAQFGFLLPFLACALDRTSHKRAQRRPRLFPVVEPNAFYLNLLVVPSGAAVDRHIDATLSPAEEPDALIPVAVAVAYVQVPNDLVGGALVLDNPRGERAEVTAVEGRFVMFAGHYAHRVTTVESSGTRMSWVLEQYALRETDLAQVPRVRIHSRAGFAAYLRGARLTSGGHRASEGKPEHDLR
jgi:hypothetical protein